MLKINNFSVSFQGSRRWNPLKPCWYVSAALSFLFFNQAVFRFLATFRLIIIEIKEK